MKRTADVAASVLARLKNIARTNGVAFSEILTRYAIERALKRIELSSSADQCILKGGCLFTAWNGDVPEPTSGLLMLLGVAGLALRRRRA